MVAGEKGLIGPNAIIQMVATLNTDWGTLGTRRLMDAVGLGAYVDQPPRSMVAQAEVAALHQQLYRVVDCQEFKRLSAEAGRRTGDYLLAHRIPRAVQWLLKRLPDALAARVLARAIQKHAWTFVGSGVFRYRWQGQLEFSITGNPITGGLHAAVPICDYYAGTFERIFRVVVNDTWRAVERSCEATGAGACVFEIGVPIDRVLPACELGNTL
jgi:divinyl protochlorophyllide a 8-vinyl-reductase